MSNFPIGNGVSVRNTETETTGTITANAQTVVATVDTSNVVSVFLSGTHAGINLTWELSSDNTNWVAVQALRSDTGASATSTGVLTSNGTFAYHIACQGMLYVRLRATAFTSGTLNVKLRAVSASSPNIVTLGATAAVTADTEITTAAASADGFTNPSVGQVGAINSVFNGVNWDRQRGNSNVTVDASSARIASGNGANGTNHNGRGMQLFVNVTAVSGTTPTMTVRVQYSFDGTTYQDADTTNLQTVSITGTGLHRLSVYPGIATAANASKNDCLPRNWRCAWTIGGTTPSFTFTTTACYVA